MGHRIELTEYRPEDLSEEDQQLKSELEMLVERLKVRGAKHSRSRRCVSYLPVYWYRKTKPISTNQLSKLSKTLSEPPRPR